MRGVVGGDAVDRAVLQALAQREDVGLGPQRRVHLVHRVVADGEVVGEQQVVRRHLGRHPPCPSTSPSGSARRAGGRHVADVQARADVPGEQHVPGDDRLLGDRGPARQAEPGGDLALVHLRAGSVSRGSSACWATTPSNALTYSRARRISRGSCDAVPVVGEDPDPRGGVGHRAELGELLAGQARR